MNDKNNAARYAIAGFSGAMLAATLASAVLIGLRAAFAPCRSCPVSEWWFAVAFLALSVLPASWLRIVLKNEV